MMKRSRLSLSVLFLAIHVVLIIFEHLIKNPNVLV
jgi:hypothetical protein